MDTKTKTCVGCGHPLINEKCVNPKCDMSAERDDDYDEMEEDLYDWDDDAEYDDF